MTRNIYLYFLAIVCFLYHGNIIEGVFVEKYENFLWGTATAAYQIEGAADSDGRQPSIWDLYSKIPGKIANNDNGDIADDSYYQYEKDVQLLKQLRVNAYRFSIAWTRIIPKGYGEINQAGIDHYNKVLNLLLENDIEPMVTLFHWDLPQGLEEKYSGLLSPHFEVDFTYFADVCFKSFGDRVKKWITLNEPWTVAVEAYGAGIFAPGRCSDRSRCQQGDSTTESYLVSHNMLNAHAAVVSLYREKYAWKQHGIIGITLNHDWAMPYTNTTENIAAAHRRSIFQLAWFADPIFFGDYPTEMRQLVGDRLPVFTAAQQARIKGSVDFLGMNHYTSKYFLDRNTTKVDSLPKIVQDSIEISAVTDGWKYDQANYESKYNPAGELIGAQAESVWLQAVPVGFYQMIMWLHRRYEHSLSPNYVVPLYITENGCSAPHESINPLPQVLNDTYRVHYFRDYLQQLDKAIQEGVHIYGYFAWSLLDNFEWADGYSKRFGLFYVDFQDPQRTRYAKSSVTWYRSYIETHQDTYSGRPYYDEIPNHIPADPILPSHNTVCTVDTCTWWQYYTNFLIESIQNTLISSGIRKEEIIADDDDESEKNTFLSSVLFDPE